MAHRADIELRYLAKAVEFSDDAIVTKDLNGIIRSWNRSAERMFGYTAEEAVGKSIRMIIPAELQGEEDTVLARLRAGESIDHYETRRQRKDGSEIRISLSVSPILNDKGTVVGATKIARDITEREQLLALTKEQALVAEKLHEVGTIVASSLDRDTIVQKVTDIATSLTHAEFGVFLYNVVNPQSGASSSLYTLSGIPKEAIANAPQPRATEVFASIFHGGSLVRRRDLSQALRDGDAPLNYGLPFSLPVRGYLAVPVKAASGEIIGGLFFGHSHPDVFTEQHERLVTGIASWASVALENSRLYFAAREADRLKDEFLAVLSHELRTPLNAILGYARLLRGHMLDADKTERGLETLERNATVLTQIVEDVLDVSRIVTGKIRLNVQAVELALVIHNAVATVQPAADAKGVRLHTVVDPRVGPVSGDPERLQQVVWNLLSNAVKFTPKNGRVHARLEQVDSHVEIVVSDTGVGIPTDFLPYVFERFRQVEAGTTRTAGGLGLGLSIVQHIVEMHGGSVHATSEGQGKGATFRVRLPVMIVRPQVLEPSSQHPRTERPSRLTNLGDLTGIHVLAIDDEEDALALLRLVLESAGASVTTASSAESALERMADIKPHVLVVDLGMPRIDGFSFIERIRSSSNENVRDIPAAALTAFARSEDRTKALRSGFEMHMAKPVDPGELVATVATLVKRPRRSSGSE
jgi:PAS domain S-box-containing protein